ncbi:MAG: response regulator [Gammaproteobacteria bacterium]|nr:MAG: response regulator [Gammaproteobacteria bacterium]
MSLTAEKKEKKILLVEDDPSTRMIIKEILRKDGYIDMLEASSGEDALSKIKEFRFDLIVCDWHMPGLSGLQLHEKLQTNTELNKAPLLMVTGESVKENIVKAIKAGVAGYVLKPLSPKSLTDNVNAIIFPNAGK